jgi:hypothetical protein
VWKTPVFAGQRVIHRWSCCGQPGYKPRSASTVVDRAAVVHRCPPAIHRLSTGFVPVPGDNVGTIPARRPQNLQQEIHTPPQAVGKNVTLGTCPHRFPQGLSTSVRRAVISCPPLGITSCVRAVDNVGTPGFDPVRVDGETRRRGGRRRLRWVGGAWERLRRGLVVRPVWAGSSRSEAVRTADWFGHSGQPWGATQAGRGGRGSAPTATGSGRPSTWTTTISVGLRGAVLAALGPARALPGPTRPGGGGRPGGVTARPGGASGPVLRLGSPGRVSERV